jgi:hypothetical protein
VASILLPGGLPPVVPDKLNDLQYHSENFLRPGDQVKQIHQEVQKCLASYVVEEDAAQHASQWRSSLTSTDPPYNIQLVVISRADGNNTQTFINYSRSEDPERVKMDFATIAYVATAASTCSWQYKTTDQAKNVNRLLTHNYGDWFKNEVAQANRHIQDKGRLDFCDDPKEKEKFERLLPSIWPEGVVGKP